MNRDPLFKALTRPAMFLGVPLTPFFLTFAGFLLLGVYTKIYYFIFFLPAFGALRLISSYDEKIFQLYGIKMWLMPARLKNYSVETTIPVAILRKILTEKKQSATKGSTQCLIWRRQSA